MKKDTYIGIAAVVVLALLVFLAVKKYGTTPPEVSINPAADNSNGKLATGAADQTFSGTISAVDTGCFADATCSVTVDGKKIVLVTGGRGLPPDTIVGRLIGVDSIGDLEKKIGEHANVYAGISADGNYTIYGNNAYYVEVITISDK